MTNGKTWSVVTTAARIAAAGAVLALGSAATAWAVPPDAGATFTNPQAQAALETGLAALKDAYTRARTAFQDAARAAA